MKAGDTYRRNYGSHLWIIISDPELEPDQVLVVNLTTVRRGHDPACVLNRGDHSFIKHATYVYYAEAKILSNRELDVLHSRGDIMLEVPMDHSILIKIREGAAVSDFIPTKYLELLRRQKLISE